VGLSFLLLDLGQGTAFLETALGYAALEGAFGAGMALGLGVASTRLGYMLQ
jgi:hypothetical protein